MFPFGRAVRSSQTKKGVQHFFFLFLDIPFFLGLHLIYSFPATDQHQFMRQIIFHSVRFNALGGGLRHALNVSIGPRAELLHPHDVTARFRVRSRDRTKPCIESGRNASVATSVCSGAFETFQKKTSSHFQGFWALCAAIKCTYSNGDWA